MTHTSANLMNNKFLFYTDPHIAGTTPRNRIDDCPTATMNEIEECYEIANKNKCDFVAMGGDLFNNHRIYSYDLISRLIDIMNNSGLQTYSAIGQHDLCGYNPESFNTSTLAFIIKHCPNFHIIREPIVLGEFVLHASHVWEKPEDSLTIKTDSSKCNVLLAHHLLYNKKAIFEVVDTKLFANGPYDVVLSGDLHCGYETHKINNRWFCNPGALSRRSIIDFERHPQVAIVDLKHKDSPIKVEKLSKAEIGLNIFNLEAIKEHKDKPERNSEELIASIANFEKISVDIYQLLEYVGKEKNLDMKVMDYILKKREATAIK